MMGYAEEAAHLGLEPEGHMLRTGDLAQREEGGLYRIVGRKSRFIKLFGLRVGLDDVERLLENNGIAAAATGNDEALLVATTGKGQADRIVDLICGRLKLPRNCVKVAELNDYPLLSSGKIDYRELQLLLQEGMSEETAVFAPQQISGDLSPKEREIAAIWQEVLGVSAISADDTFFNLGGDSLSAITVMLKMEKAGIPEEVSRQIFDGCTIAEIADQGDKAGRPRIRSVESMTSNAINFTRGLLVLIVIGAHWGPFLLERLGTFGEMFTAWTWPIFRFGTPGFAMVFGLGLGYFWSPLVDSNRTRLANRVKTSLAVVCSGLAVIVVFRLLKWALGGAAPDVDWPTFVFYDVLLFYVFAVATVYPILLVCRKAEFPPMAAIAIALTSLAVSQAFAPLLESTATGFTKLGAIMLASNYSYPLMLSYTMIGMAAGLWIQINNHRPLLARMAAWGGGTLFFAGILLSIASGLTERWFVGTPHLNAIVSYSGVLLLAFAAAFAWEQYRTGATGLVFRVLAVLGILALPAYVIHAAAIPLKQILELLGAPIILAVGVAVLLTAALLGLAVYRVYSIYFGNLVRNRRETGAEHVAASVSEG